MLVSHELTRRDFVTGAGALAAAVLLPAAATARRPPAEGTVVLFQGDSITDGGRNRAASEPNQPGGLGSSYPLLVASAALAAHPDRALKFYNRGVSGNKVPDLEQRWAAILGRGRRPPHAGRACRDRGAVASRRAPVARNSSSFFSSEVCDRMRLRCVTVCA